METVYLIFPPVWNYRGDMNKNINLTKFIAVQTLDKLHFKENLMH